MTDFPIWQVRAEANRRKILYFFGDGTGNFVIQPVVGPAGQFIAVGDFNGDGIPDVVVPDRLALSHSHLDGKTAAFPRGCP